MFGIDFSEILVIFGIALVVLGPERLPKLAATIGRWIGRARAMARQFREQLEQEAGSLHHGVDLGPEFGGSASSSSAGPRAAPPGQRPAHSAPVTEPAASEPATAMPSAAAVQSTEAAQPAVDPQSGWLPAELTLADTYPAGLHPTAAPTQPTQPAPPAVASESAATHSSNPPEPQQATLWPPDGLP